jgi:hypothetical protein
VCAALAVLVVLANIFAQTTRTSVQAQTAGDGPAREAKNLAGTARWTPLLAEVSAETGVPVDVLRALMSVTSGGNPIKKQAGSDGRGLMLVTPALQADPAYTVDGNIWDPAVNARIAARYLAGVMPELGSWDLAVADYVGLLQAEPERPQVSEALLADDHDVIGRFQRALTTLGHQPYGSEIAGEALLFALETLGTPYVWGGQSFAQGGFDCSGLVVWAYEQAGWWLPRTAADQWHATTRIDESELRPGDLVFFENTYQPGISHVGIYAGNGYMLHAPKENDVVRFASLASLYWQEHFAGYGRIAG